MNLAVVGSRTFKDYDLLDGVLCRILFFTRDDNIISGGAAGADTLGMQFADNQGIDCKVFIPDWAKYGKSAGFLRNQLIVDACDIVVAFWDGKSKGTKDTIDKARIAKKPTYIVYF